METAQHFAIELPVACVGVGVGTVAEAIGIPVDAARQWISDGLVPHWNEHGLLLVNPADVIDWMDRSGYGAASIAKARACMKLPQK